MSQHATSAVVPTRDTHQVWEVYDGLRTARYERLFYTSKLCSVQLIDRWMEILIALFVPASALASLAVWRTSYGTLAWGGAVTIATVLSVVKPFLKTAESIRTYSETVIRYGVVEAEFLELASLIRQHQDYDARLRERFAVADRSLIAANTHAPAELQPQRAQERLYCRVNQELPKDDFYVPGF